MDTNLAYILPKYHVVQQHKSQHDPVKHMNLTISQHFITFSIFGVSLLVPGMQSRAPLVHPCRSKAPASRMVNISHKMTIYDTPLRWTSLAMTSGVATGPLSRQ